MEVIHSAADAGGNRFPHPQSRGPGGADICEIVRLTGAADGRNKHTFINSCLK